MTPVEVPLEADARVVSYSSVWIVRGDRYCRMPRVEGPRNPPLCIDDALQDVAWHQHEGVWVQFRPVRLRILPAGRPEGSHGILTGQLVELDAQTEALITRTRGWDLKTRRNLGFVP